MKIKWLKHSLLATSAIGVIAPTVCFAASCQKKDPVDIKTISLSLKPNFIMPGQTVRVRKTIYPYAATNNPLKWEIIDCPYEGFKISQDGRITAPKGLEITDPKMMHIRATDAANEKVYDELAIAIVKDVDPDQPFIGFANNEVIYINVEGQKESVKILKDATSNTYTTEHPIELYSEARPFENIEFLPIVGKGYNNRMKFHLHGDESETLRALSWVGYRDNSWIDEIPTFKVTFVEHVYDVMDIKFACDDSVSLQIKFNVYLGRCTPARIDYQDEDYHNIYETSDAIFGSPIRLPIKKGEDTEYSDVMTHIYVHRKPYEHLDKDDFTFSIKYPSPLVTSPQITEDRIKCEIESDFTELRQYDNYKVYDVTLKFTIDLTKFEAKTWNYKSVQVLTFDVSDVKGNGCYCNFYAQWYNFEEEQ